MSGVPIKDFENYLIFKDGSIWSVKQNKFLKLEKYKEYYRVKLYNNGVRKMFYIHLLLKEYFDTKDYFNTNINLSRVSKGIPIKDFEEYEIFKDGSIWSNKQNKFLKPQERNGLYRVELLNNEGRKMFYIHLLLKEYF